jgi:hypothetical protein
MNYQKFIQQLPDLYENWGQVSVAPKSHRFDQALQQVKGMTTANVMQLLNFALDCMEPDEIYCEVGCFQGSTLEPQHGGRGSIKSNRRFVVKPD